MVQRRLLVASVAAFILGACSGSVPSSGAPVSAAAPSRTAVGATAPSAPASSVATTSPGASSAAGVVVGGDRPVTVHVPASYDASRSAPLVILLHGYSSSAEDMDGYVGFKAAADKAGFVYAAPDGTLDSRGNRFWNATDACCNFDDRSVDDVAYLSGVIADIQGRLAIDPRRIAIVGHSNGGFMAYRMACERADLVAVIVSLAGESFADPADCRPSEPVSVAQVQGTSDDTISFGGGGPLTGDTGPYPGAESTARAWATYDGCGPIAAMQDTKIDVDADLQDGANPAETSVREWGGCGAGSTVQLWTIPDGGHVPALTPAFADAVAGFLVNHPKP